MWISTRPITKLGTDRNSEGSPAASPGQIVWERTGTSDRHRQQRATTSPRREDKRRGENLGDRLHGPVDRIDSQVAGYEVDRGDS